MKFLIYALAATFLMAAAGEKAQASCSSNNAGASIGGAIIGGIIGHQFGRGRGRDVGTVIGAVVGWNIGCAIGEAERERIAETHNVYFDAELGRPYGWNTSETRGDITYLENGYLYDDEAVRCRSYRNTVYGPRGEREVKSGSVCRYPDRTIREVEVTRIRY